MSEKRQPRSRKKKSWKAVKAAAVCGVLVIAASGAGAGYYIQRGRQYETVFFPSTVINGMDASHKTVEEVKQMISQEIDDYVLTLVKRGGETEEITKEDIGLHSVFDGSLEQYLAAQNPMEWALRQNSSPSYEIEAMVAWDEKKLAETIDALDMFDENLVQEPENAYLSEYIPGEGFQVMEEKPGTLLDKEKVEAAVREALGTLKPEVVLEDLDAYKKAEITREDKELNEMADRLNRYVQLKITYVFGDQREILDGDTIVGWISTGEDGEVVVNQEEVAAFVKGLAVSHDTAYKAKTLNTSYGQKVEIGRGFYGWRIDQSKEAEQLYEILLSGESQEREPVYVQKAASHGDHDYGNTYVEINLTAQHLFFYKNGKLVIESDFVSGSSARGDDTPAGAYPLTYKQRNAVLKGATYRTPVSYWMPFNGNIGMHDAGWRGSFGGNIYKTNGSHGCINLPPSVAKVIFENIEAGMPVLCYHLPGTEGGGKTGGETPVKPAVPAESPAVPVETAGAGNGGGQEERVPETESAAAPGQVAPIETVAPETLPAETGTVQGSGAAEGGGNPPTESEGVTEEEPEIGPGVGNWTRVEVGPGVESSGEE